MSEQHPFRESVSVPGEHVLDLACRAHDLPPSVERRKKSLVEEILGLCRKYGFSHPKELALSPDSQKVSLQDLETIESLLKKLEHIIIHHELPEGEEAECPLDRTEYSIELPLHATVSEVLDDRGRPVVVGIEGDFLFAKDVEGRCWKEPVGLRTNQVSLTMCGNKPVMVCYKKAEGHKVFFTFRHLDGSIVGDLPIVEKRGQTVHEATLTRQRVTDLVFQEDSPRGLLWHHPVDARGKLIGRLKGYYSVGDLLSIGDKTYFVAQEERESLFRLYNEEGDQASEEEGEEAFKLFFLKGKLVLCVKESDLWFFKHFDGKPLEDSSKRGFASIDKPQVVGEKICFWEKRFSHFSAEAYHFTDHTGETFGKVLTDYTPTEWKMLGDDLFYWEGGTRPGWVNHMDCLGRKRRLGFGPVLPIRVGHHLTHIKKFSDGCHVLIETSLSPLAIFEDVYSLESLDEHQFYVIAMQEGKIVKRVFTI